MIINYRGVTVDLYSADVPGFGEAYKFRVFGEIPLKGGFPKKVDRDFAFASVNDRDESYKTLIDWYVDHEQALLGYLEKMLSGDADTIDFLADKATKIAFILNNEIKTGVQLDDGYHYQVLAAHALLLKAKISCPDESADLTNKASMRLRRAISMHRLSIRPR